jgi:hypothetical protein
VEMKSAWSYPVLYFFRLPSLNDLSITCFNQPCQAKGEYAWPQACTYPLSPSGSDHRRSHMGPSWGTSCFRSIVRIWSKVWMEGERPPCTQKI